MLCSRNLGTPYRNLGTPEIWGEIWGHQEKSGDTIQIKLQPRGGEAALDGPAADTDPNVAYTWGYGLDGSGAKYARLEKITLPGGREIYYNYEDANAFASWHGHPILIKTGTDTEIGFNLVSVPDFLISPTAALISGFLGRLQGSLPACRARL